MDITYLNYLAEVTVVVGLVYMWYRQQKQIAVLRAELNLFRYVGRNTAPGGFKSITHDNHFSAEVFKHHHLHKEKPIFGHTGGVFSYTMAEDIHMQVYDAVNVVISDAACAVSKVPYDVKYELYDAPNMGTYRGADWNKVRPMVTALAYVYKVAMPEYMLTPKNEADEFTKAAELASRLIGGSLIAIPTDTAVTPEQHGKIKKSITEQSRTELTTYAMKTVVAYIDHMRMTSSFNYGIFGIHNAQIKEIGKLKSINELENMIPLNRQTVNANIVTAFASMVGMSIPVSYIDGVDIDPSRVVQVMKSLMQEKHLAATRTTPKVVVDNAAEES